MKQPITRLITSIKRRSRRNVASRTLCEALFNVCKVFLQKFFICNCKLTLTSLNLSMAATHLFVITAIINSYKTFKTFRILTKIAIQVDKLALQALTSKKVARVLIHSLKLSVF